LVSGAFYFFLGLPYESRNYGLLVGMVLVIFCIWFGLGIIFDGDLGLRLISVILPLIFFVGFGMFTALLPFNFGGRMVLTLIFGLVFYVIFLVDNVFMVSIGFRTVPLYRAAYTVNLIILLLASFFLFNSLYSYKFDYWVNTLAVTVFSVLIFIYQFFCIAIELPEDWKNKNIAVYILIPAYLMAQLALVFSFWPVGIFKGSIYLVSAIYVLSSLMEADIRGRLFRKTWLSMVWVGLAIILGILLATSWR
jgi:hypothetical protein